MSKSIFIIDTPACRGECPMSGTDVCREWNMEEAQTFPKDWPLKPAYDVDKVVERLENKALEHAITGQQYGEDGYDNHEKEEQCIKQGIKESIEIVKSGGIE